MVEVKELRLGSIVYFNNYEPVHESQIRAISWLDFEQLSVDKHAKRYSPIPLTPEILEKCGFEQEGTEAGDDGAMELGDTNMEKGTAFLYVPKEGRYMQKESLGLWVGQEYGQQQIQVNIDKCQYLHQLQNLFYALTGEELNYTP